MQREEWGFWSLPKQPVYIHHPLWIVGIGTARRVPAWSVCPSPCPRAVNNPDGREEGLLTFAFLLAQNLVRDKNSLNWTKGDKQTSHAADVLKALRSIFLAKCHINTALDWTSPWTFRPLKIIQTRTWGMKSSYFFNGYSVPVWGDGEIPFWRWIVVIVAQHCEWTSCH